MDTKLTRKENDKRINKEFKNLRTRFDTLTTNTTKRKMLSIIDVLEKNCALRNKTHKLYLLNIPDLIYNHDYSYFESKFVNTHNFHNLNLCIYYLLHIINHNLNTNFFEKLIKLYNININDYKTEIILFLNMHTNCKYGIPNLITLIEQFGLKFDDGDDFITVELKNYNENNYKQIKIYLIDILICKYFLSKNCDYLTDLQYLIDNKYISTDLNYGDYNNRLNVFAHIKIEYYNTTVFNSLYKFIKDNNLMKSFECVYMRVTDILMYVKKPQLTEINKYPIHYTTFDEFIEYIKFLQCILNNN